MLEENMTHVCKIHFCRSVYLVPVHGTFDSRASPAALDPSLADHPVVTPPFPAPAAADHRNSAATALFDELGRRWQHQYSG